MFDKLIDCQHKHTHFDPAGWPTGEDLEVCDDCGMSRTHWEQGESPWTMVDDIEDERRRFEGEMRALDQAHEEA